MSVGEFAAIIVAIAVVVTAVFLIVAVNNLNNTLARLSDTANELRSEGIAAFTELRALVADADAELDKVDLVLDRADLATSAISETSRRTHEAVQDPVIRTLAIASGSSKVGRAWLWSRRKKNRAKAAEALPELQIEPGQSRRRRSPVAR
ncbi:MAG: DUF948 domain-containing protein [Acidimicrobiia bacterium]|nr:DUF948 domain-containing protein [Acidimicrobiia bacterium]